MKTSAKIFLAVAATAVALVFTVICLKVVRSGKNTMKWSLETFLGTHINIPGELLPETFSNSAQAYLIIYYDSVSCASCRIRRIGEWNSLLEEADTYGLEKLFIFSPAIRDSSEFETERRRACIPYPVLADYGRLFQKSNPHIPADSRLHVFLLDGDRNVVLAGDPMRDNLLWEMYLRQIKALTANGGVLPEGSEDDLRRFINERRHPANGLYFESLSEDIGQIPAGEQTVTTFTATNVSETQLRIEYTITDCDCAWAEASASEIQPGGKCVIRVMLSPDRTGEFTRYIFVKVGDNGSETTLTIKGTAI